MWGEAEGERTGHGIHRMEGARGAGGCGQGDQGALTIPEEGDMGTDHSRNGFQMAQYFLFHKRPKARGPWALC